MRKAFTFSIFIIAYLFASQSGFAQGVIDPMVDTNSIRNMQIMGRDSAGVDTVNAPKQEGSKAQTIPADTVQQATISNIPFADTLKTDSVLPKKKAKRHSPLKAVLFSAVLPGLGQGYNKKYWKIPIVYAGYGGLGYALYYTVTEFKGYRAAYRLQVDEDPNTIGDYRGEKNAATLRAYRDYYKRFVDISAICTAVWYTLTLVDAAVDAHLFEWNMRDDLNVSWRPVMLNTAAPNSYTAGAGFSVRLSF